MGSRNKFWSVPCLDGFPESNLISLGVSAQGLGADESDDAVNSSCLLYCGRALEEVEMESEQGKINIANPPINSIMEWQLAWG